jgi:hypothetical protein
MNNLFPKCLNLKKRRYSALRLFIFQIKRRKYWEKNLYSRLIIFSMRNKFNLLKRNY